MVYFFAILKNGDGNLPQHLTETESDQHIIFSVI